MCSNGVWPEELDEDFTEMEKQTNKQTKQKKLGDEWLVTAESRHPSWLY